MSAKIDQLIAEYDRAFEDWTPKSKRLAELEREVQVFILAHVRMGMRPDPADDVKKRAESMRKFVPRGSLDAEELEGLIARLTEARAKAMPAAERMQAATDALREETEDLNDRYIDELLTRRRDMIVQITSFLSPYCNSVGKARELAEQCDRVAEMEFTYLQSATIRDLRSRAGALSRGKK
jgi:hypothetical protein